MGKWPNILGRADNEATDDNVAPFPSLERDETPTQRHGRHLGQQPITRDELVEFFQENAALFKPLPVPADPLPANIALEIRCAREIFAEIYRFQEEASRARVMKMVEMFKELYAAEREHPEGSPV
jgi:hypothetical protein